MWFENDVCLDPTTQLINLKCCGLNLDNIKLSALIMLDKILI